MSRPFWEAAKRHALVMPRCKSCQHIFFYPRENCPKCFSTEIEWTEVSGRGRLYTFTIVHKPSDPSFYSDVPYVFAIVELPEGPRLVSNIVDCPIEDVYIDMPLTAVFEDITPEWTLVKFKPA